MAGVRVTSTTRRAISTHGTTLLGRRGIGHGAQELEACEEVYIRAGTARKLLENGHVVKERHLEPLDFGLSHGRRLSEDPRRSGWLPWSSSTNG